MWLENRINQIPLTDMILSRHSLFEAFIDISRGRTSKTTEPVQVWFTDENNYQLVDGYHRVFVAILSGVKYMQVEIIGSGYSDYWASIRPNDIFQYVPNSPYGGLEDLADEEILDELKLRFNI